MENNFCVEPFGVNKKTFEESIEKYIKSLKFAPELLNGLEATFLNKYRRREQEIVRASGNIHQNIADLELEQATKLEAFTSTKSSVIREKLEQEIETLELRIKEARKERNKIQITRDDIKSFMSEAKIIMEHPSEILLNPRDIRVSADLFSLVFEKMPTYEEVVNGTAKLSYAFRLSSTFTQDKSQLVTLRGDSSATPRLFCLVTKHASGFRLRTQAKQLACCRVMNKNGSGKNQSLFL